MSLFDEVLEAHGGAVRWNAARRVHARARSGGFLLRTRVPGTRFADYRAPFPTMVWIALTDLRVDTG